MPANPSSVEADTRAEPWRERLAGHFTEVRHHSVALAAPLSAEDQCIQSMPDASPTKWHLAHTSWFFEAVVLAPHAPGYEPFDRRFFHLFNSYYESLGSRHPRPQRGLLTRPGRSAGLPPTRGCGDAALHRRGFGANLGSRRPAGRAGPEP
jgi:hypothetical protein